MRIKLSIPMIGPNVQWEPMSNVDHLNMHPNTYNALNFLGKQMVMLSIFIVVPGPIRPEKIKTYLATVYHYII